MSLHSSSAVAPWQTQRHNVRSARQEPLVCRQQHSGSSVTFKSLPEQCSCSFFSCGEKIERERFDRTEIRGEGGGGGGTTVEL